MASYRAGRKKRPKDPPSGNTKKTRIQDADIEKVFKLVKKNGRAGAIKLLNDGRIISPKHGFPWTLDVLEQFIRENKEIALFCGLGPKP